MENFSYENQGSETLLVYHFGDEEHIDSFAKGMLQQNRLKNVLQPLFTQIDTDIYLKYPVTSMITLKDFLERDAVKKQLLNFFIHLAEGFMDLSDYMLSEEKIVLDPSFVFINIRTNEIGLVYLPIDEYDAGITIKDFLLNLLCHMKYDSSEDLSYVGEIINYLNREKVVDNEKLITFLHTLEHKSLKQMKQINPVSDIRASKPREMEILPKAEDKKANPTSNIAAVSSAYAESVPEVNHVNTAKMPVPPAIPAAPVEQIRKAEPIQPTVPQSLASSENKPKKGLFGFGKAGKENKSSASKAEVTPKIPGFTVPSQSDSAPMVPPIPPMIDVPPVGMKVNPAVDQKKEVNKKKGLFSFGKKTKPDVIKESKDVMIPQPVTSGAPLVPPIQVQRPSAVAESREVSSCSISSVNETVAGQNYLKEDMDKQQMARNNSLQSQPVSSERNYSSAEDEDLHTVISSHGDSDDGNHTVILGGNSKVSETGNMVKTARLVRRKNGQSMTINREVFYIGSQADFVDFFVADNPAVGACHAEIYKEGNDYFVSDRNSVNHTYVDHMMLQPMQAAQLRNGNIISLGDEDFEFVLS